MYPNYYPKRTKQIDKSRRFVEGKDRWGKEYAKRDKEKADIRNVTIAQFTQEIKKRASLKELAKILEETELTMPDGEKKYKFEEMFGGYESKKLAQAISAHITEGLE